MISVRSAVAGVAIDQAREALLDQVGQVARMVDVRVGKDDRVNCFWIKWKIPVLFDCFLAPPLIQSAIQQ